ncbi:MAG: acyl carrier protein [candidate division Zixibacteria bacterium]|nr:acyl carrier protein [candidate division Zixibacteria bacterium]
MEMEAIRSTVKEIIANATNINPVDIGDTASFQEDLGLDSLSLLEIAVDVDHMFKLNLSDEELSARLQELRTVQDAVEFVQSFKTQGVSA